MSLLDQILCKLKKLTKRVRRLELELEEHEHDNQTTTTQDCELYDVFGNPIN